MRVFVSFFFWRGSDGVGLCRKLLLLVLQIPHLHSNQTTVSDRANSTDDLFTAAGNVDVRLTGPDLEARQLSVATSLRGTLSQPFSSLDSHSTCAVFGNLERLMCRSHSLL